MEFSKEGMKRLGEDLQQWHSGGDAIYQAGSYLYAGHNPSFGVLFDALRLMTANYQDAMNRKDHPAAIHAFRTMHTLINYIEYRQAFDQYIN